MKRARVFGCCFLLSVLFVAAAAQADVRLPSVIGENMVLQQKQTAILWGWAENGERITVTLEGNTADATADSAGRWRVEIQPPPAGGPYTLTFEGANTITLSNVMVGEVWICSGQSNMAWPVARALNPEEEIAAADYPNIRLFTVARKIADKPQDDCVGTWTPCTPQTIEQFSAVGYFFGRQLHKELDVPVGLINTSWGGTVAEAWTSRGTLAGDSDFSAILQRAATFNERNPNQASVLYNGMIKPLVPFAIRGAIWYQGEANVRRAEQYAKLFPAMITDWRKSWGQGDFPFLYVQLAPFRYARSDPAECAELWEAQFKTLALPNTGMAVTTDIGDVKDIHPRNKQETGRRLSLWALAAVYGKDIVYSGPLYDSMQVEGDTIRISFKHTGDGLKSSDGNALTYFTIASEEGEFVSATATIDGDTVVVHSDEVAKPAHVRFAWTDTAEPNLVNDAGLPASPFRTDSRKLVTAGKR
jgi:sialate O-acetylesterase